MGQLMNNELQTVAMRTGATGVACVTSVAGTHLQGRNEWGGVYNFHNNSQNNLLNFQFETFATSSVQKHNLNLLQL